METELDVVRQKKAETENRFKELSVAITQVEKQLEDLKRERDQVIGSAITLDALEKEFSKMIAQESRISKNTAAPVA